MDFDSRSVRVYVHMQVLGLFSHASMHIFLVYAHYADAQTHIHKHTPMSISICLSVKCVNQPVYLPIHVAIYLSTYLLIYPRTHIPTYLPMYPCIHLSTHLSV